MLEFGCELCFPVGEGTSTGFMHAGAHVMSAFFSLYLGWLIDGQERIKSYEGVSFILLSFVVSFVLTWFIK